MGYFTFREETMDEIRSEAGAGGALAKLERRVRDRQHPEFAALETVAEPVYRLILDESSGVTAEYVVGAFAQASPRRKTPAFSEEHVRAAIAYLIACEKVRVEETAYLDKPGGVLWLVAAVKQRDEW